VQADFVALGFRVSACKNRRYESNWIASKYGVPRMLGRLPKFLRMRFFSVNE